MTSRPRPPSRAVGVGDRLGDRRILERLAAVEADVAQDLRQRIEAVADLADRPAELLHHRQHLQRRDEAVAGRRIVGEDDVAGLLAADIVALLAHPLDHVAVADRGALERRGRAPPR